MPIPEDDLDGGELTERERRALRRIIRDQERADWLWATLRIWAAWVSGAIVGAYALWEVALKFFGRKVGGS